jgi:homoserine O-acetyltransferase
MIMPRCCIFFLLTTLLAACATFAAQASKPIKIPASPGDFLATNFRFENGQTLPFVTLHYTTLGAPKRDESGRCQNAVLLLHGITGNSQAFLSPAMHRELFAPGQPLDATRYYIIIPDALGRGGSSKPSDSLRMRFPKYSDADIVQAQYRLITEGLQVDHLNLILGVASGGLQTWLWGEQYPEAMDALMPIASQPTLLGGYDGLWRKILIEAIRQDPEWKQGNYATKPTQWLNTLALLPLLATNPEHLQNAANSPKRVDDLFKTLIDDAKRQFDANDTLYWLESSHTTNPEPDLVKIKAKLYALNFQDDHLITTHPEHMSDLVTKVQQGHFVELPQSEDTYGHQTFAHPEVWKCHLEQLLQPFSSEQGKSQDKHSTEKNAIYPTRHLKES